MVQAQVSLKNGGTGTFLIYIISSRFIILNMEITKLSRKLCYAFQEKKLFSASIIL